MERKGLKVAIIGAGAVGLYLAWKLAGKGHKVVVFEKGEKVGQKACSCLVSERIKDFFDIPDSVMGDKISHCLIHFPKKSVKLNFRPVHFILEREDLDNILFKKALEAGAEIIFNTKIESIPAGFDKIIGCDGALSFVRSESGIKSPSFRLGIQAFQALKKEDLSKGIVEVWPVERGFCWKIPRKEQLEYGAMGGIDSVSAYFGKFCEEQSIRSKLYLTKTALIPQGLVLPDSENVTLCGDAAGLTKPWSGGGIIWGLKAADILLKNFPSFKKYTREAGRFFSFKMKKGILISRLVHSFGERVPFLLPSEVSRDNDFPFL